MSSSNKTVLFEERYRRGSNRDAWPLVASYASDEEMRLPVAQQWFTARRNSTESHVNEISRASAAVTDGVRPVSDVEMAETPEPPPWRAAATPSRAQGSYRSGHSERDSKRPSKMVSSSL